MEAPNLEQNEGSSEFIIGIRFRNNNTIYDFKSTIPFRIGDRCVVEVKNCEEFGIVTLNKRKSSKDKYKKPLRRIIRKATSQDFERIEKNISLEKEADALCRAIIKEKGMQVDLITVEFSLDSQRAIFYLTGEGRIDLKPLIKELANHFNIRIETKQVGLRESARILGGCGLCGKELCCASFLREFKPVSIKMAKDQNIALSPMKISGICGRLLCCMSYEYDTYKELNQKIPKCGQCVECSQGKGRVVKRELIKEEVEILLDGEADEKKTIRVSADDIKLINNEEAKKQRREEVGNKEGKKSR